MSDTSTASFLRRTLIAGASAMALFAGFAAVPALVSRPAHAQEIQPTPVAPPGGAPMSFANLIEHVRPAVVSISVRQRPDAAQSPSLEGLPPGFEQFFRGQPGRPQPAPVALGSGFFIDGNGTIVTNHHVIDGAEEITIHTSDGRDLPAEVVGSDELTDLAVLRVRGGGHFPYVTFDDATHVRVGDWVVAVGNPFGLDGTATAGIVSAMGRRDAGSSAYVDYMQIDAPINRGNSGGPTFDLAGNVIGVNSAIYSPTGGSVGIGFAIPSNVASRVVAQLLRSGRVTRGWIGVSIQPLDEDIAHSVGLQNTHGALVGAVVADGPAAHAGIQQGDVILAFNGQSIEDSRDLTQRVGATPIGQTSRIEVLRNGQRRTLTIQPRERPSEQQLASADGSGGGQNVTPQQPNVVQGALGITVRPITPAERTQYQLNANESGVVITAMDQSSGLLDKGVTVGDVILQAGGRTVHSAQELTAAAEQARRAGRPLLMQVYGRGGRRFVAADVGQG
ncbi:MAG: Do family serine endopeptidase [Proteobacteria bacterium]|nr:Do family serine endopeptidase [Pseudomonadota bacterium]